MKLVFGSAPDCGGVGMKGYIPCCSMPGCPAPGPIWPGCWPGWPLVSGKSKDCILWCEAPRMAAKCVGEVGRFKPRLMGEVWCWPGCSWCGDTTWLMAVGGDREWLDCTDWGGDRMGDMCGLQVMLAGMDCCRMWGP